MKPVVWLGDSLARLREFPADAMHDIYLARLPEAVYVLHVFQKKSRKTAQPDMELARRRMRSLLAERRRI